jgi:tRNA modification GTPase
MTGVSATIAAIATGPAAGGIGIIRISGPNALAAARRVVRGLPAEPIARHAYFVHFVDAQERVLDEGLALWFAAPRSFTGEDVVELHGHGAPKLLSMLLEEILRGETVRLATPGEFTRRAYLAGRIELTRAEAVADLIAAESEAQVRAAAAQLSGEFGERLARVKAPLLALQADVEGALDFPEEAEGAERDAAGRLLEIEKNARSLLDDAKRGALVRRGARVVLSGPVNAGKSTLFNALLGANRALVDEEPGTTRDTLEGRLELHGLAVTLVDTAGLREGAGRIEAMGIERTKEALASADVAVELVPPGATPTRTEALIVHTKLDTLSAEAAARDLSVRVDANTSGVDAPTEQRQEVVGVQSGGAAKTSMTGLRNDGSIGVSAKTGAGLDALREALFARLGGTLAGAVISSSERHVRGLTDLVDALERANSAARVSTLEVVAGEIGLALAAIAELDGSDARTELLDAIFQRFCIGK